MFFSFLLCVCVCVGDEGKGETYNSMWIEAFVPSYCLCTECPVASSRGQGKGGGGCPECGGSLMIQLARCGSLSV